MKSNKKSFYAIIFLVMAIVLMSIGFAITSYTQLLEINGSNVTVKSASWNVHYDRDSYVETTGSVTGTHTLSNTLFTYDVTLSPDEFYSAEFDVVNDGTFDAKLSSLIMTPTLSNDELGYLEYYVEYDGQVYRESQVFSSVLSLPANSRKRIKVYIKYFTTDGNEDKLPEEDHTLSLSVSLNYNQV